MTCSTTVELAAYVLGAITSQERDRIDTHLIDCRTCQRELILLAPLPGLLLRASAEEIAGLQDAAETEPAEPLAEARRRISRRRGRRWLIAAVTGISVVAGVGGLWAAGAFPPAESGHTTELSGSDPDTGVHLNAQLSPRQWGTEVDLRLSGLPDGARCRLIVHSRNGASEVSGSWQATRYAATMLPAATSVTLADISSIDVVTDTGRNLIELPNTAE